MLEFLFFTCLLTPFQILTVLTNLINNIKTLYLLKCFDDALISPIFFFRSYIPYPCILWSLSILEYKLMLIALLNLIFC